MSDDPKASNRAAFPRTASVVDAWRAVFGADTKLLYAEEDGQVIGMKLEDRVRTEKTEGEAA
jgi:hypothetical protein